MFNDTKPKSMKDLCSPTSPIPFLFTNIPSSIIYSMDLDIKRHHGEAPNIELEFRSATNAKVNEVYEKVLKYNDVAKESVTIEMGRKMIERLMEPKITLSKTKYTACLTGKIDKFSVTVVFFTVEHST